MSVSKQFRIFLSMTIANSSTLKEVHTVCPHSLTTGELAASTLALSFGEVWLRAPSERERRERERHKRDRESERETRERMIV